MAVLINESELEFVNGGYTGPCFVYEIKKGDCLSVIAQRFNTTVSLLCEINNISNPNKIYAGNRIYIPYKA